jgi:hypothetical protein
MKYGFEREFFVKANGKYVICPFVIAHDDCGYLAESRGEPHADPLKAAYLLLADEDKLKDQAKRNRVQLVLEDTAKLSPEVRRDALRRNGKGKYPVERGNLYGLDYKATDDILRAGLHVHFSNEIETKNKYTASGFLDIPRIVRKLDEAFAEVIKKANRLKGFYETKKHGFEYRSLPASVDPRKVAEVIARGF